MKEIDIETMGFGDLIISANNNEWKEAVIVFTKSSFNEDYPEVSRSYKVSSEEKYFDNNMNGSSLHGYCLDGSDQGVRLDQYIQNDWTVDYCYIIK